MSNENEDEEIQLAHNDYIISKGIDINSLPKEFDTRLDAIDSLIDSYESEPTDEKFSEIEAQSIALKGEIENWFNAEEKRKSDEAKAAAEAEAEKQKQSQQSPPKPIEQTEIQEEEGEDWSGGWSI